jgi:error-prone DNA polymerase
MVAADYTPGEADQLRRDMAAWRRTGRIERHRDRLISRMERKGIERAFAERVFDQIRGFGEYGFPESHAASFALIAYAAAWMKQHYHDVFTCSLLNALPMGFYAPSTIIDDAKRHGVEVRPLDVAESFWDCTLEPAREENPRCTERTRCAFRIPCAVRVGFCYVKGMREAEWDRIVQAREERPFASPEDFADRTGLNDAMLTRLAEAGAFARFEQRRRQALWSVKGLAQTERPVLDLAAQERKPDLEGLDLFETVVWDYRTTSLSTRAHPLATIRKQLRARGLPDARTLNAMADGARAHFAGIAICRQRPATASGVVFITLEDETGFVNLVIYTKVFEQNAVLIKTTSFLGVTGKIQKQDGVVHIIAERFWTPHFVRRPESMESRDFQ